MYCITFDTRLLVYNITYSIHVTDHQPDLAQAMKFYNIWLEAFKKNMKRGSSLYVTKTKCFGVGNRRHNSFVVAKHVTQYDTVLTTDVYWLILKRLVM